MNKIQTPTDELRSILERLANASFSSEESAAARRIAAKALQPLAWREFLVTAWLEAKTGMSVYTLACEIEQLFPTPPDESPPDCKFDYYDDYVSLKLTTLEGVELSGHVPMGQTRADTFENSTRVKPEWIQFFVIYNSTRYSLSRLATISEARAVEIVTAIGSQQNPQLRQDLQASPPTPFDMARVLGVHNKKLEAHGIRFRSRTGTQENIISQT